MQIPKILTAYEAMEKLLASAKNPENGKPIARNTRLYKKGGKFSIVLYSTTIVEVFPDHFHVACGGFHTPTTRERINQFSPARANIKNRQIHINGKPLGSDGIDLDLQGNIIAGGEKNPKRLEMEKKIDGYIKGFVGFMRNQSIEPTEKVPSGRDCWHCYMRTEQGEPLGDKLNDVGHLISHIEENYFVPSLLVNAFRENGWTDHRIRFLYMDLCKGKWSTDIKRALKKYFMRRIDAMI